MLKAVNDVPVPKTSKPQKIVPLLSLRCEYI